MIIYCDICFEKCFERSKYDLICGHILCTKCNNKCEKICLICNQEKILKSKYNETNPFRLNDILNDSEEDIIYNYNSGVTRIDTTHIDLSFNNPYIINSGLLNGSLRIEQLYSEILPNYNNTSSANVTQYTGVIPINQIFRNRLILPPDLD